AKQPVRFAVDTIGEEEGVWASAIVVDASTSEAEKPKAARHVIAYINGDRTLEHSGCRVEGVDLARHKAEIADQQVAPKRTKTGWGESNAPWCSEGGVGAAEYRLQQGPACIKNRHRSHPGSGTSLVCKSGWRVSRIHFVADALHVERY